jgi:hypothetical protein
MTNDYIYDAENYDYGPRQVKEDTTAADADRKFAPKYGEQGELGAWGSKIIFGNEIRGEVRLTASELSDVREKAKRIVDDEIALYLQYGNTWSAYQLIKEGLVNLIERTILDERKKTDEPT